MNWNICRWIPYPLCYDPLHLHDTILINPCFCYLRYHLDWTHLAEICILLSALFEFIYASVMGVCWYCLWERLVCDYQLCDLLFGLEVVFVRPCWVPSLTILAALCMVYFAPVILTITRHTNLCQHRHNIYQTFSSLAMNGPVIISTAYNFMKDITT